jgi:hypothetical protein
MHNSILVQNDKVSPVAAVTQIRGARKVNNDQVSIDVEMEKDKPLDEDDDKGETDVLHIGISLDAPVKCLS